MLILPMGPLPDKPLKMDTLVSVLKSRLRGEKDVSVRRFIRRKLKQLSGEPEIKHQEPFFDGEPVT